jgi:DNA-binding NtrC family response regulator
VTERPKSSPPNTNVAIVFVVEDDASMRRALINLFQSVGLGVQAFSSASEMLQSKLPDAASCLVLDVRLPGLSGLDFQTELAKANVHIPIIFMTGHGDISMTVRAMKGGAVDFLTKPFRDARPAITASPVGSMRAMSNVGTPSSLSGGTGDPASAAAAASAFACAAASASGP